MDFKSQLNASTVDVNVLELLLIQDKSTNESIHNQCIDRARSLTLAQTLTDNTAGMVQVSSVPIWSDPIRSDMAANSNDCWMVWYYYYYTLSSTKFKFKVGADRIESSYILRWIWISLTASWTSRPPILHCIILWLPQWQVKKEYEKAVM